MKFVKVNPKPKQLFNIVNVYEQTSKRAKKLSGEMHIIYNKLNELCKQLHGISISEIIIAGDFRAKLAKKIS